MQEKKNVRRLISLILLLSGVVAVYFFQQGERQALVDPSLFKAEDLGKIDRVLLELKDRKVDLHFDGSHWKVNQFEADRTLIDVLFAALAQAAPKRPVALGQRDSINHALDLDGVTVSLFEGPVLRKQFLAGGLPQTKETYFRLDANSETYLITIPGYRVYLAGIFSIDENGWRDKRIFDFAWRNFKTLAAAFPKEPAADFVISRPDMSLTVSIAGMNEPDTARVNTFLDDVLQLTADQILAPGALPQFDSLAKTLPVTRIIVGDIASRTYTLELFPPLSGETFVLGKAHAEDLVLFERKKVFRVAKKKSYFRRQGGK